jgi:hypothetical protein
MAMKPALLTAMSGSPVLMQGWLNKAPSSSFGKAENRFFVLSGITMKYYDSEQMAPTNLKGKFDVMDSGGHELFDVIETDSSSDLKRKRKASISDNGEVTAITFSLVPKQSHRDAGNTRVWKLLIKPGVTDPRPTYHRWKDALEPTRVQRFRLEQASREEARRKRLEEEQKTSLRLQNQAARTAAQSAAAEQEMQNQTELQAALAAAAVAGAAMSTSTLLDRLDLDFGAGVDDDISGDCDVCLVFPVEYKRKEEEECPCDHHDDVSTAVGQELGSSSGSGPSSQDPLRAAEEGTPAAAEAKKAQKAETKSAAAAAAAASPASELFQQEEEDVSYGVHGEDSYKRVEFAQCNPKHMSNLVLRKSVPRRFFDHPDCEYVAHLVNI